MKYITLCVLLLAGIAGQGQMKGDTTNPCTRCWPKIQSGNTIFQDIVLLLQQNKELSDRLDRAEKRIDSLERRPYLFIDNKGVRPGLILTNAAGEFQIFVAPL